MKNGREYRKRKNLFAIYTHAGTSFFAGNEKWMIYEHLEGDLEDAVKQATFLHENGIDGKMYIKDCQTGQITHIQR